LHVLVSPAHFANNPAMSTVADPSANRPLAADSAEGGVEGVSETNADFRSGFVALCGRPNVGKSTLLNALMGQQLAVATRFPQTTRERMLGVWTTDKFQALLVDTPGIHRAKSALNKYMVKEALRGARDVDLVLFLADLPRLRSIEAAREWTPGPGVLDALEQLRSAGDPKIVLILTKSDQITHSDILLPILDRWRQIHDFAAMLPVSALEGKTRGLEALERTVAELLPKGPHYYDKDQLSDRDTRWHVAEAIRGELFAHLGDELPYSCAVCIASYKETATKDTIRASIHVERDSQKGMVIGRAGKKIKSISTASRAKAEALVGRPCDLFLDVRVTRNWTKDPKKLEAFGYVEDRT